MWEPSLISPWQQTGKHLKREKERKEEYLVFPFDSQLFFIKGQLDLFSSITACCRLEWLLLLFSSVLQQNPSTSKLTLLSPYRKVFIFSSLSGASCQATSEDSTNSCFCRQSRFFFSLLPCVCRFLCEAAATAAQLPQKLQLFSLWTCERDPSDNCAHSFCCKMFNLSFKGCNSCQCVGTSELIYSSSAVTHMRFLLFADHTVAFCKDRCDTTFLSLCEIHKRGSFFLFARSRPILTSRLTRAKSTDTRREYKQAVGQTGGQTQRHTHTHTHKGSEVNSLTAVCSFLTGGGLNTLSSSAASVLWF